MRIAYLIMTHNTPHHLPRLIDALAHEAACFFIHLDAKSSFHPYAGMASDRVRFINERRDVQWGDYSQVKAALALLREALQSSEEFQRFVLLSGADYPLRSASFIHRFFTSHRKHEFMNVVPMPSAEANKPLERLTLFHIRRTRSLPGFWFRRILMACRLISRHRDYAHALQGRRPFGGSAWWALTRDACSFILNTAQREIHMMNFFKNTRNPDEMMFHTILANSPFRAKIVGNLTYADWRKGGPHPAVLSERHLDLFRRMVSPEHDLKLRQPEVLFARKFPDDSEHLVKKIRETVIGPADEAAIFPFPRKIRRPHALRQ